MIGYQVVFNLVVGVAGILIVFVLNSIWGLLKELRAVDRELTNRLAEIEILVAGGYVANHRFEEFVKDMFIHLDRIENKLDLKVGRIECDTKHGTI